jgi:hypothetical protein
MEYMVNHRVVLACALALGMIPLSGRATDVVWPELPKDCFVRDRPATAVDLKAGCAAFVIGKAGTPAGTPVDIKIPQYAWHVDQASGKKAPVILIQAEESSGIKVVGYKDASSNGLGAALLTEMILLGNETQGR